MNEVGAYCLGPSQSGGEEVTDDVEEADSTLQVLAAQCSF
jgi:hypothetical protein